MAEHADDISGIPQTAPDQAVDRTDKPEPLQSDVNLHKRIAKTIRADRKFHEKAFARMRLSMKVALRGRTDDWSEKNYTANIIGRHIKQKTAALYAKNPKAVARRRETLDFTVWDEDQQSLMVAFQTLQAAQQMAQPQATTAQDPNTGIHHIVPPLAPALPPGFQQAQAVVADFQQGMARRQYIKKIGKTLEVLFAQSLREQKPLDFKSSIKQMVRRAATTCVGYIEVGFQREYGPRPGMTEKLADARARLDHLRKLQQDQAEGEIEIDDAETAELERSLADLEQQPEIVLREGLIFDFPQSTRVIPDSLCKSLIGFVGARHLTIEYLFTKDEVREMFDVDIGRLYTKYTSDGRSTSSDDGNGQAELPFGGDDGDKKDDGLCCVWKYYDKPSGLVYYLCDGYEGFLRDPAAPDVFVEDFWPVYALTFNAVESEDELFPPSDVELALSMQKEHNRSRQGKREHREFARPRSFGRKGLLDDEDHEKLRSTEPFTFTELNTDVPIDQVLMFPKVPGVDPNLYDVNEVWSDMQVVLGGQEAQYGGVSKSTATEAAIASNSSSSSDGSSIDDLDSFLTAVARASGQILLKEMSPEKVAEIAGPGAVWPEMSLADIANELFLEVEAGSTGKPNQAVEMANWEKMLPFLLQMQGIQPTWLARETLRRLDDRMDLTDALSDGLASIVAQNRMATTAQPGADPANAPEAQGGQQGPAAPAGPSGTGPAFGSNQV
jgi:hypothetical protein